MSEILLYHGSKEEVVYPEIRITRYTKDFSWGFYCTNSYQQAYRWADRRSADGIVNVYRYVENPDLKILRFPEMSDEWLDFIAKCRAGETHPYDIVEGPMAVVQAKPIPMILWRVPWQMTPSGTMSMDLRPGRSAVKHFGHWRSSSIQHTRSAFIP